jgi:hypothetical protein
MIDWLHDVWLPIITNIASAIIIWLAAKLWVSILYATNVIKLKHEEQMNVNPVYKDIIEIFKMAAKAFLDVNFGVLTAIERIGEMRKKGK